MTTITTSSDEKEPCYTSVASDGEMLLPSPDMLTELAAMNGLVSAQTENAIKHLAEAAAAPNPADVVPICSEILAALRKVVGSAEAVAKDKPEIYDQFFGIRRLASDATKDEIIRAMVAAAARTLRTSAEMQRRGTAVSAIEFGALRLAYASISEALNDIALKIS